MACFELIAEPDDGTAQIVESQFSLFFVDLSQFTGTDFLTVQALNDQFHKGVLDTMQEEVLPDTLTVEPIRDDFSVSPIESLLVDSIEDSWEAAPHV